MGKIYHLKSNFFSKKCIFFISDTGTGAKKIRLISPRAAMRVCKAILTHLRNAQRFLSCKKHLPETTKKKAAEPVPASDTDLIDEKRRLPVGTIPKTTAARQLGNNCCFV